MTVLMKGHRVVRPPTRYSFVQFGIVKRSYYKKFGVVYDIKWENEDAEQSFNQSTIDSMIKRKELLLFNNDKDVLKFKLTGL